MATYVSKKCPYCGYAYQINQSGEQRKYGCPYQTCSRCGNAYWDMDIVEPALHGYQNTYETMQMIKRIIAFIIYASIGLIFLIFGLMFLMGGETMGFVAIGLGVIFICLMLSYVKQKFDDKKHWEVIVVNRQQDYDQSIERLKDINYLTALSQYDTLAKRLLNERLNGEIEHYAKRP